MDWRPASSQSKFSIKIAGLIAVFDCHISLERTRGMWNPLLEMKIPLTPLRSESQIQQGRRQQKKTLQVLFQGREL